MQKISPFLQDWYKEHQRDLPWRNTRNPYVIWLSEIILQQTRVNQGLPYFVKFLEAFPDVVSFAASDQEKILKLWQGLGYYSRARNMHETAKEIVSKYNGSFPRTYLELLKLKGIGEYTAAAIASFAFQEKVALVDGNVYRVLSRFFGEHTPIDSTEGKKKFKMLAAEILDLNAPDIHNQAIMEFGALQCTPKNPNCKICIFKMDCVAFQKNEVDILPHKAKKVKMTERFFNYLLIRDADGFLFQQRKNKDIWHKLFEFPLVETPKAILFEEELLEHIHAFGEIKQVKKVTAVKHLLTHQKLWVSFWEINMHAIFKTDFVVINAQNYQKFAMPKVIADQFLYSISNY